ncbi:glycosyltransferase family 2 protein [Cryobacterium sp.]|uniref:glycosyltransferase family 2 protein n=1 Tax=Cryobacterium sp. TaxID=1926290 RepID=UPI002614A2E4|nr:glycosyltransferase family 2 protein [Cryobacterium sp.]MCU1447353.1 hypothetical protein [Cryobacterium sp.]
MPSKSLTSPARKRQLGAERNTEPLPTVHDIPSDSKITWGRLAIIATVAAWVAYIIYTILRQFLNNGTESFRFTTEAVSYVIVVTFLTFSALMYLIARQGALQRFRDHVRVPRAELDSHFATHQGSLTVLVPSYSEEPGVVRATLWSAALQEYPDLRIVLLLDDPPYPADPAVALQLQASRSIARDIELALAEPRARFTEDLLLCELELANDPQPGTAAVQRLAEEYQWAARWLQAMASAETIDDHVDTFFVEQVLGGLAAELSLIGAALAAAAKEGTTPTAARMLELHRRLVWTFSAELDTFERKLYASLSHDANKAMNLNAYIGLMGRRYRREDGPDGAILRQVADDVPADFVVRDSEYLLTLDADSLLLRDYCLRLVYLLEQPDNARVAVTQTPYSSFRGAPTRIERLAGASTDIQHILHQGMTHHGATFWVGANAVIRKVALEDIVEVETVGGFEVRRYVQDRTVIEDTESSIDLGTHGWSLVNYPERLSYSATPPDFGSLIVQRRRWANGGLLILPKLWRQMRERRRQGRPIGLIELALRVNYMTSIAWASFGLIFLLAYPYDSRLLSPVVVLAALPYFLAMGSDLRYCGYKFSDIMRIYGFNLILLPVNLAGVLKSLQQAVTSKKIPFARTPKVRNRTAAPIMFVVVPFLIVAFSALTLWRDVSNENWGNAAFAGFNALLASFAIVSYIGIWNSVVDVFLGLTQWMFIERAPRRATAAAVVPQSEPALDWRAVLYHGHAVGELPRDVELVTGPFVQASAAKRAKTGAVK